MKTLMCCEAAALVLLSGAAFAQDKTLDPNRITVESKRAPLEFTERQRAVIQDGLASENTEQKVPPKFEAKVGDPVPLTMTLDVMPPQLLEREPSLKQYGYAKLPKQLLVIDPMKKTIIAVLLRQEPTGGKAQAPADWAATRGRELTGQAPQPTKDSSAPEPAGDSGDKSNGTEKNTNQK